ncbi:general transcription factor IIH [Heterostelium album PN500]|uniref:General transcription factor IIH subunit 3 n=1 Tax=Heterostelium pallidum (strain ATCC 26659 / Pp 5 / PN500) TaxID=670386 RepID=D3AZM3_HETP5|nr:general transcription factor IIH [Heterostelium album PN500]EFA85402.1 general transcription factor IIH [Heterostelium album PN500]|eukprot:XP_020437511.1 general transcription factor IIH [Heterostelium album PN500]
MDSITSLMNEDDDNSLLVIVADFNIYSWGQRAQTVQSEGRDGRRFPLITLPTFIENLLVFINAYLMLNQENQIALISSVIGESYFVYPPQPQQALTDHRCISEQIQSSLERINTICLENLDKRSEEQQQQDCTSSFSAAMSLALCYINRIKKEFPSLRARILVFNLSPDVSTQYIPVMNCIFSAQKQSIPVDSCVLSTTDSTFLQQASHLTNGIYLKPQRQENLSQYLLSTFLVDSFSRNTKFALKYDLSKITNASATTSATTTTTTTTTSSTNSN